MGECFEESFLGYLYEILLERLVVGTRHEKPDREQSRNRNLLSAVAASERIWHEEGHRAVIISNYHHLRAELREYVHTTDWSPG